MGILGTLRDLPLVICRRYGFWDGAETLGPRRWLAAAEALPDDDEDDDDDDPADTGGSGGAELLLVSAMGLTVASIGSH